MISRQVEEKLKQLISQFPVVCVVGPRQSGKTTLVKNTLPEYAYVTMEDLDKRKLAVDDPRRFLAAFDNAKGVIIDEVQEAPDLLSYMQGIVDQQYRPGFFVLTGSQNILLHEKVSQTLAGRIAFLTLLPLTVDELQKAQLLPLTLEELLFKGCYPRLYSQNVNLEDWFSNYISTYVERDVRQILKVMDLVVFQNFLKLCAGRVGQLLNYTALASDCGISPNTAKNWISLLQSCYIIFLAQPYFKNFNKRVVKTPKLYFYDTGLCCSLLEITSSRQLFTNYSRGPLFESFVASEFAKYQFNLGKKPNNYFWRDVQGNEVDCVLSFGEKLLPVEIKSGLTFDSSFFKGLNFWNKIVDQPSTDTFVVYAGAETFDHKHGTVVSWRNLKSIVEKLLLV